MSALRFLQLPVEPDDGLPQAFSCFVGPISYDFGLYANLDSADAPPSTLYDLGSPDAVKRPVRPRGYLVRRVVGPGPAGPRIVFLRKLVAEPNLVHYAGPLAIKLVEARVACGNLNGRGHFGTRIVIGVAQRWE